MLTRRTATVTMSAPDASCACCMIWWVGYLPVPMIRRERNSRPAMTKGSIRLILSPADEVDDLDLVAVLNVGPRVGVALDDDEVALDGDAARVDLEPGEKIGNRDRRVGREGIAIQHDAEAAAAHRSTSSPNGRISSRSRRSPGLRTYAGSVTSGAGRAIASAITRS